ncbi:MAG: cation:proton antiporter [Woeseiaceae bacterium]
MEALWIGAAFVLGLLGRQFGLPPLAGYLIAGFVLHAFHFESGPLLDAVAHYGVLLLLFSVGLKLDLRGLLQQSILGTAVVHLLITGGLLFLIVQASTDLDWHGSLFLAITLGFSSTVLAAKVLEARREVRAFHGRIAIGILIFQDIVAVGLLSFAGDHSPSPYALLLFGLPLIRPLLHRLLEISGHDELLILFGLLLALAGGTGFEQLGLSSELGALVLGAMLAGHAKAVELFKSLWGLKEAFLVGFFLQIGLTGLPDETGLFYLALFMLFLPLKSLMFFFLLLVFRLRSRSAFLVSITLSSYSEFALICVPVGIQAGWISPEWAVILALAVMFSFMVTAPINRMVHGLYARFESKLLPLQTTERHPDEQPLLLGRSHILVLGMGRSGTAAYDFLKKRGMRVAGLDSDPTKVARHRKAGRRVLFADSEDPGLWTNLELDEVQAVLITMPDLQSTNLSVKELRGHGFKGLIGATTHYSEENRSLVEAGADMTFLTYEESGVGLAEHLVEAMEPQ